MQLSHSESSRQLPETPYLSTIHSFLNQLLDVLIVLEQNKVMHRDLKPDNVMVTRQLQLKLIDFGNSKRADISSTICGSPGFMAPELMLNSAQQYSNKVDVWAAGAIIYQMLFGYLPFVRTMSFPFNTLQLTNGLYLPFDLFDPKPITPLYIEIIE